jgi:hypothetical protein
VINSLSRRTRIAAAAVALTAISLSTPGGSAQRWDNEPTVYLYHTTCADAATSRNATEISDLESDRITLDRVWREIGTSDDRPNGMLGEIDDIDRLGDVQSLVDGDNAVVIHQDESRQSPIIACVDIEGTVNADGALMLDIAEVDGSGMDGRVMIRPEDRDDDEIEFVIGLWPVGSVAPVAEATPAS